MESFILVRLQDLAELDLKRIKAASLEVVRAHHRQIPSRSGGIGPVGVLRSEMVKRGASPIRQLMLKAGVAIQALKPVMMMSPLSVAHSHPGKTKVRSSGHGRSESDTTC